jgi:hypothetical protein
MVESTAQDGVEWAGDGDRPETKQRSWPVLRSASPDPCDGRNPRTDRLCRLGYHQGYHRDDAGVEWLDD